jgi:hypothetical protein
VGYHGTRRCFFTIPTEAEGSAVAAFGIGGTGKLSIPDLIQYAYNLPKSQIVGDPE